MNLNIRKMVRESIEKILEEEMNLLKNPPESFQHFRKILVNRLSRSKNTKNLIEYVENSSQNSEIFEILYDVWKNVKNELSYASNKNEAFVIWKNISSYYLQEAEAKISSHVI